MSTSLPSFFQVSKSGEEEFDVIELPPLQSNLFAVDESSNGNESASGFNDDKSTVTVDVDVGGGRSYGIALTSFASKLASFLANNKTTITAMITMLVFVGGAFIAGFSTNGNGAAVGQKQKQQLQAFDEVGDFVGYERIPGLGECEDSNGNLYSYTSYELDSFDPEACGALCGECPGPGDPNPTTGLTLQGFEIDDDLICYCLVDYGPDFDEVCVDEDQVEDDYDEGVGEIVGVDGNEDFVCWKFVGFPPTKQPTDQPTKQQQPTDQPTKQPTDQPTKQPGTTTSKSSKDTSKSSKRPNRTNTQIQRSFNKSAAATLNRPAITFNVLSLLVFNTVMIAIVVHNFI